MVAYASETVSERLEGCVRTSPDTYKVVKGKVLDGCEVRFGLVSTRAISYSSAS